MAFCQFSDTFALFDCTPVENLFIQEYMLRAPGEYVKVYLYGLMQCYHPTQSMSIEVMAKDLGISLSHYSKLEIGIGGMSHGLALALCRQFDLPEEWLLYGLGPQPDLAAVQLQPRASKTIAASVNALTDEMLVEIMEMVTQADFMGLAERVSTTMDISLPRAMAMLAREKIRAKRQACLPQLPGLPTLSEEELPLPENSGEEK